MKFRILIKIYTLIFLFLMFQAGFSQEFDTVKTENKRLTFTKEQLYVPGGLMIAGIASEIGRKNSLDNAVLEERTEHLFGFTNHADDYLQFAPFVAAYAFEWAGMKPRTNWKNRTAIMIKGQFLNLGTIYILKTTLKRTRPDGTSFSFPSGHTANVFAGATWLSTEYGKNYKWVPYAAYGLASGVGIMRIVNNKHYVSDVLFGAGLGILCMKIAYWTHQYKWNTTKTDKDPFAGLIYSTEQP